jgi:hypothetical protein
LIIMLTEATERTMSSRKAGADSTVLCYAIAEQVANRGLGFVDLPEIHGAVSAVRELAAFRYAPRKLGAGGTMRQDGTAQAEYLKMADDV